MSEFKVGDKVRVIERHDHDETCVHVGAVGEVVSADDNNLPRWGHVYEVRFESGSDDALTRYQLELVSETSQVFKLQVPEEPPVGSRVRPVNGNPAAVWERQGDSWVAQFTGYRQGWEGLVWSYPDGLEPVPEESEYDAAVSLFRDDPGMIRVLANGVGGTVPQKHAAVIVRHVVEGKS